MKITTGRFPSLLAWGLLVGGISLLITFPEINTDDGLFLGAIPAALLFVLGGLVFGLSHPGGRDWIGAVLLGWVPAVVGVLSLVTATGTGAALSPVVLITAPGLLSAAGAAMGAGLARWRARTA